MKAPNPPPLELTVSPLAPRMLALIGVALVLAAPLFDNWTIGARLVAAIVGAALTLGMALVALRTRARLEIGKLLVYRRAGVEVTLPLAAARAVVIERRPAGLTRPTAYWLRVLIDGEERSLLIAQHTLAGHAAHACARRLAKRLAIPLRDPVGDRLRASRFAPARWLADGEEWRVALLAAAPAALALFAYWALR